MLFRKFESYILRNVNYLDLSSLPLPLHLKYSKDLIFFKKSWIQLSKYEIDHGRSYSCTTQHGFYIYLEKGSHRQRKTSQHLVSFECFKIHHNFDSAYREVQKSHKRTVQKGSCLPWGVWKLAGNCIVICAGLGPPEGGAGCLTPMLLDLGSCCPGVEGASLIPMGAGSTRGWGAKDGTKLRGSLAPTGFRTNLTGLPVGIAGQEGEGTVLWAGSIARGSCFPLAALTGGSAAKAACSGGPGAMTLPRTAAAATGGVVVMKEEKGTGGHRTRAWGAARAIPQHSSRQRCSGAEQKLRSWRCGKTSRRVPSSQANNHTVTHPPPLPPTLFFFFAGMHVGIPRPPTRTVREETSGTCRCGWCYTYEWRHPTKPSTD